MHPTASTAVRVLGCCGTPARSGKRPSRRVEQNRKKRANARTKSRGSSRCLARPRLNQGRNEIARGNCQGRHPPPGSLKGGETQRQALLKMFRSHVLTNQRRSSPVSRRGLHDPCSPCLAWAYSTYSYRYRPTTDLLCNYSVLQFPGTCYPASRPCLHSCHILQELDLQSVILCFLAHDVTCSGASSFICI